MVSVIATADLNEFNEFKIKKNFSRHFDHKEMRFQKKAGLDGQELAWLVYSLSIVLYYL